MKNFLRNIGSIAIALSFVSSAHGMMTPTSGAACAMEEHIQEKTFNITSRTTLEQLDVDLNKGQDGAERPFRPFRKFYVFKSAVDAFDQVALPLTPVIEGLGLPFEALSRPAVQQFFMNTPSLRAVRLFGDENSVVAYSVISPLLQRSQLVTLDFGQCILSPGDMRLFASDLRQTRGLKDLTVRPKVQAFDQLEYMRALNDLGQALGTNTSLRVLNMTDAQLEEGFLDALARGLQVNTTLEELVFNYVRSSVPGRADLNADRVANAFIAVLTGNSTLKKLELLGCGAYRSARVTELEALAAEKSMTFNGGD